VTVIGNPTITVWIHESGNVEELTLLMYYVRSCLDSSIDVLLAYEVSYKNTVSSVFETCAKQSSAEKCIYVAVARVKSVYTAGNMTLQGLRACVS
jgi:hypothetical protein